MIERYISPERHKMVIVGYGGHSFLTIFTRLGRYVGILDVDSVCDDLVDWSRLFSLGALAPSDLL
jgi:hypothetical protein